MLIRLISLSALLALGCGSPMTHSANNAVPEGWPPSVDAVLPPAAPAGSVVTLEGTYLNDASQVLIGGEPANFTHSGPFIKATVPQDLGPGPAKVVVMVSPTGMTAPETFRVKP